MFDFLFRKKTINNQEDTNKAICSVDTKDIKLLYDYIENKSGIVLNTNKPMIEQKIITFCLENKIKSFFTLLEYLQKEDSLWNFFLNTITINETYFFREKEQILESLQVYKTQKNQNIDILCLPSSTGEEVYSVVMIALEMQLSNFRVTGVDIDKIVLEKAKDGIFNERSLHRLDHDTRIKYFDIDRNTFYIKNSIKKLTKFYEYNIFDKDIQFLGKFDIIFSRNMFIYFNDARKIEAYKQLKRLKKNKNSKIHLGHADISSRLNEYIKSDSY